MTVGLTMSHRMASLELYKNKIDELQYNTPVSKTKMGEHCVFLASDIVERDVAVCHSSVPDMGPITSPLNALLQGEDAFTCFELNVDGMKNAVVCTNTTADDVLDVLDVNESLVNTFPQYAAQAKEHLIRMFDGSVNAVHNDQSRLSNQLRDEVKDLKHQLQSMTREYEQTPQVQITNGESVQTREIANVS